MLTDQQFLFVCSNGRTVFQNITSVFQLCLMKPKREYSDDTKDEKKVKEMTQVKKYIVSSLIG
jgi:hypothetical protein